MSDYTFRGGYIEDSSGDRWWSSELLSKVERERDEARDNNARLRELADIAAGEQGLAQRRMIEAQEQRDKAVREVTFLRNHYSMETASKLRAEVAAARAEIARLTSDLENSIDESPEAGWKARALDAERETAKLTTRLNAAEDLHKKSMDLIHEAAGIKRDGLAAILAWIEEARAR